MPSLGTLSTELTLDSSNLDRNASRAEGTLGRLGNRARSVTSAVAKMGVGLGAAGAALTAALTKQGLAAVDSQAKLARSLDATADGLRAVQIAASDAGISASVMEDSLEKLNQRIGEAQRGSGTAADSLARLGINADDLSRMDADQRMAALADAMTSSGLTASQAADELRQLGIRNSELTNLMRQGGDAIRSARAEVDEYGLSLSDVDAAQVESANDAFSRVGRTVEALRQRLAVQLAPLIEFVADLINDAAKEAGGFRDQMDAAITRGVRLGAKLADVVEGLRRAFLLSGQAGATAGLMITSSMLRAAEMIMSGPVRAINALIRTANEVPFVDISEVEQPDIVTGLRDEIALAEMAVEEGKAAMQETLLREMPSTGIERKLEEIRAKSREAAEQVVADRERMSGSTGGAPDAGDGAEDDAAQRRIEQMEEERDRFLESLMGKEEQEEAHFERRLERLNEFLENELITQEEWDQAKEELEQRHMDRMADIRRGGMDAVQRIVDSAMKGQVSATLKGLSEMSAGMASENRKMFEANKAAAIGEAIVSAYKGISTTLSAYPFPLSAAMAAAQGALAFAQVNAIKSQSFGSKGGAAPSLAGSTPATPVTPTGGGEGSGGTAIIRLEGERFSASQVRELISSINEEVQSGARLITT